MFGEISEGAAAGLALVSFFASFMTASFGIGGGTLMLAVLASVLPAPLIIPVHGAVQLGSNAGRFALLSRHADWSLSFGFTIGALAGVAAGGAVVVELSAGAIQLVVGAFILWTLFFRPPGAVLRFSWLAGAASSFLTMFVGGTGPFVAAYVRSAVPDKVPFVATTALLMTAQHGLKTLMFVFLGVAFAPWLGLMAALIGAGFLGTWTGKRVLLSVPDRFFRIVIAGVLGAMALRLIWQGLGAL